MTKLVGVAKKGKAPQHPLIDNTHSNFIASDNNSSDLPQFTSIESLPVTDETPQRLKECVYEIPQGASGQDVYTCRAALWGLMFIMSLAGILAVYLHHKKHYLDPIELSKMKSDYLKSEAESENNGEKRLEQGLYSTNIENIASRCARMASAENSFAIFENGTCVLVLEPIQDPVVSAKSTLQILADPHTSFHVKAMNNNNYLVIFNKYIFVWLFAEDIAKAKIAIMDDSRLDSNRPTANAKLKMSPFEQRLGKLARLLMVKDSQDLELKELIRKEKTDGQAATGPNNGALKKSAAPAAAFSLDSTRNTDSGSSMLMQAKPNQ